MNPRQPYLLLSQPPCRYGADHRQPAVALTVKQYRQFYAHAKAGKTTRWLASHFGISARKVNSILRVRKTPTPPLSPPVELAAVAG